MKRILITGANGWIGKHVVPLFSDEWEMHCVTSRSPAMSNQLPTVNWHQIDLLQPDQVTQLIQCIQPTHCIHLAWIATPGVYTTSEENNDWLKASQHLFAELIENNVKHITGIGSSFEYDWSNGHCIEGITALEPNTLYGQCKRDCGLDVLKRASIAGITASWGRIFFIYGPNEPAKKLVASTITALLANEAVDTTEGTQLRDYMHIDDVAAAIHHLTVNECIGDFNISSGTSIMVRSIIEIIEQATQKENLVRYGARPMASHEPPLIEGNNQKLQRTGWKQKFTLQSGVQNAVEWWAKQ